MPFFLLRRLCGLLFLASLFFSVQPAFSADCESYHPEARGADTSHPDDGWIVEKYGRVCTRTDEDQGQWDDYTQSEAACKSPLWLHRVIKDQGAGFNRRIFDPPESDGGAVGISEQSGGERRRRRPRDRTSLPIRKRRRLRRAGLLRQRHRHQRLQAGGRFRQHGANPGPAKSEQQPMVFGGEGLQPLFRESHRRRFGRAGKGCGPLHR